jgi:dephospho-CoA kinase
MLTLALTGGIGSGKSTVGGLLAERGAVILETDRFAREALEPGGSGFDAVAGRFPTVIGDDGAIDRKALASVVFADDAARADLEGIVHPAVRARVLSELEARKDSDDVVVIDVPLFVETGGRNRYPVTGVLVVDAPEEVARERLIRDRAMTADQANERIAAQVSRTERIAVADFVIYNVGTPAELAEMVANAWAWIEQLRAESDGRAPRGPE